MVLNCLGLSLTCRVEFFKIFESVEVDLELGKAGRFNVWNGGVRGNSIGVRTIRIDWIWEDIVLEQI